MECIEDNCVTNLKINFGLIKKPGSGSAELRGILEVC